MNLIELTNTLILELKYRKLTEKKLNDYFNFVKANFNQINRLGDYSVYRDSCGIFAFMMELPEIIDNEEDRQVISGIGYYIASKGIEFYATDSRGQLSLEKANIIIDLLGRRLSLLEFSYTQMCNIIRESDILERGQYFSIYDQDFIQFKEEKSVYWKMLLYDAYIIKKISETNSALFQNTEILKLGLRHYSNLKNHYTSKIINSVTPSEAEMIQKALEGDEYNKKLYKFLKHKFEFENDFEFI